MGHFKYGISQFDIEDRVLAHLQFVYGQIARRRENFLLTIHYDRSGERLHSSVWLTSTSDVHFAFSGSRQPELNRDWLELMLKATHSNQGLDLERIVEPAQETRQAS